jgi:hypothetical protein
MAETDMSIELVKFSERGCSILVASLAIATEVEDCSVPSCATSTTTVPFSERAWPFGLAYHESVVTPTGKV